MALDAKIIGKFEDKFGEERTLHRDQTGTLRVAQDGPTPVIELNRVIAVLVGQKIREKRLELGMSLADLCILSGLVSTYPKSRMWEIEKGTRKGHGIRFGTLYALSAALGVQPCDLLPSPEKVFDKAGVTLVRGPTQLGFVSK